jgi:hypothetical protein
MIESIFVKTFGRAPIVRVLDYMILNEGLDYPKTDISYSTGVSRDTLNKLWPNLLKSGILKKTRSVSNVDMYSMDKDNPIAQKLIDLDFAVSSRAAEHEIQKQSSPISA